MKYTSKVVVRAVAGAMVSATPVFADDFTFRIGSGHPKGPAAYVTAMSDFFAAEVERRVEEETEHTVKFVEAYGGAIAGVADTLESVQSGILDFGGYCVCFEPSKLFLHNFPYYLAFGPENSSDAIEAARVAYAENPWLTEIFEDEYDQVFLGLGVWDNYHLGTTFEWDETSDLKGVKIGGAGPNLAWLEYIGSIPVQSTLPEGYLAMRTGVYEGWLMVPSAYNGFKYYEPAPYYTLIGFGAMPVIALTANQSKMESLPDDVREIVLEVGREWEARNGPKMDEVQAFGLSQLEANNAKITTLPEAVREEWAQSLAGFPAQQAADAEGRGFPGVAVMQSYIAAAEAVGHTWPVNYVLE